ncbi:hypothetical protein EV383_4084 [Pseudonocardia sediminis]|uniref:site-specific DNA-methyltransferase (adenine-specific) n=1 Tax=Pseudonocardia sediminis TaxID=1397368 RepID=A0A4Q7UZF2_PSEST|nr:hypothetical protein EV383_4084 [Pseudonocardia sediminis]
MVAPRPVGASGERQVRERTMTSTESTATINALVKDLRKLALDLEKDLKVRARDDEEIATRLGKEYEAARSAERTAAGYTEWLGGRVTQAAAAWVLSTVFVRYCEDNGLIDRRFLAGPGEHLAEAEDYQNAFITANPTLNNRNWLEASFQHIADAHPTAAGLFDPTHNPLWDITISYESANDLIAFWRRRDHSGTAIRYDFTGWDTRFLGDIYQDLSEAARKTYALLQTPEFVEEFILDLTLDPAIDEFGLDGLRTIDPACGSGHFLLGIFRRILTRLRAEESGSDDWSAIRRALESVHGCDKNPFAVSIARFRLLVAAVIEGDVTRLDRAGVFPINVAVGDSLLHGRGVTGRQGELGDPTDSYVYSTEDINQFIRQCDLLGRSSYQVVVGNPPYITVKDRRDSRAYRDRYTSCSGKYALSAPFTERLFQLAIRGGSAKPAGFVGQITSNSFMKREFGEKLVRDVLPQVDLTHIVDCSGAYIPNHGTPTVILVGRNAAFRKDAPVRILRRVEGEPAPPTDPAFGLVWSSIRKSVNAPGYKDR